MNKLIKLKEDFVSIASLFTSVSTLLCCALPALLVTLGMGAVVVGVISELPWLVTLSRHKEWIFLIAGIMIGFNFWLFYGRKRKQTCKIDENGNETACDTAAKWSKVILWISSGLYLIGLFMSYVILPLQLWLGF